MQKEPIGEDENSKKLKEKIECLKTGKKQLENILSGMLDMKTQFVVKNDPSLESKVQELDNTQTQLMKDLQEIRAFLHTVPDDAEKGIAAADKLISLAMGHKDGWKSMRIRLIGLLS